MGLAIAEAAADAVAQLTDWARTSLALDGPGVVVEAGGVAIGDRHLGWGDVVRAWFGSAGGEVIGRGYLRRAGATEELPPFWEIGCVGAEVEVDESTGVVTVLRLVTVGDVGCAINPALVEGQDIGAATMGLGMALREELALRIGEPAQRQPVRVPRAAGERRARLRRRPRGARHDGVGVYGAKGGGEGSLNPVAAAVAAAIHQAAGIELHEAPFTPERVWRAIQERDRSSD